VISQKNALVLAVMLLCLIFTRTTALKVNYAVKYALLPLPLGKTASLSSMPLGALTVHVHLNLKSIESFSSSINAPILDALTTYTIKPRFPKRNLKAIRRIITNYTTFTENSQ
jgi:hypothetical protein